MPEGSYVKSKEFLRGLDLLEVLYRGGWPDTIITTYARYSSAWKRWCFRPGRERECWYHQLGTEYCVLLEAKICKFNQRGCTTSVQRARNNTNLGVCKVICHHAYGASRGLSKRRVPETELLKQERVVTKHVCGTLRTHKRRHRVSLGSAVIGMSCNLVFKSGGGCTHGGSHDKNWVLELLRAERGEPFNTMDRPSIRTVTEEAIVSGTSLENASSCTYPRLQMVPT